MTELDFEELDKAVNNLMKDATRQDASSATTDDTSMAATVALSAGAAITDGAQPDETRTTLEPRADAGNTTDEGTDDVSSSAPSVAPPPSLATKRRGRFMDVIHPSLDTKPATSAPKRVGVTLRPMAPDIRPFTPTGAAELPTDQPVVDTPSQDVRDASSTSLTSQSTEAQDADNTDTTVETSHLDAPHNDYPDPLMLQMEREVTGAAPEETASSAIDVQPMSAVALAESTPAEAMIPSLVSTSLPEAAAEPEFDNTPDNEAEAESPDAIDEVQSTSDSAPVRDSEGEDRAVAQTASPSPASTPDEAPLTSPFLPNAHVEKRPLGSVSSENLLPSQSDTDLVGASDDSRVDTEVIASQKEAIDIPLPAELSGEITSVESVDVSSTPPDPNVDEDRTPTAGSEQASSLGGSIPQQYNEQPSSTAPASGGIYDTQTYHHPLEHPAKKKSGVGVVVWILVLLILGALAGAAYFYLKMR